MNKINMIEGKSHIKVCETHAAKMHAGGKFTPPSMREMFNCADCYMMGDNPTDDELIEGTDQDVDPEALQDRIKALDIS